MLTVRHPNGLETQFNDVTTWRLRGGVFWLYAGDPDKDGRQIAYVVQEPGLQLEWDKPCAVVQPIVSDETLLDGVILRAPGMKGGARSKLRTLKRLLKKFNAKTWQWEEPRNGNRSKK